MALKIHIVVFWVMTPCSAVKMKVVHSSEMMVSYHITTTSQPRHTTNMCIQNLCVCLWSINLVSFTWLAQCFISYQCETN